MIHIAAFCIIGFTIGWIWAVIIAVGALVLTIICEGG